MDLGDDAFGDYAKVANTFGFAGKRYRAPLLSAAVVMWGKDVHRRMLQTTASYEETVAQMVASGCEIPVPADQSMEVTVLGQQLVDELVADQVPYEVVERATQAIWIGTLTGSQELARAVARGDDPNAPSPANRQERRAAAKKTSRTASDSRTTGTAAASTTRSRASGTGTSTPMPSAKSAPVKPSRGTRSSASGTS